MVSDSDTQIQMDEVADPKDLRGLRIDGERKNWEKEERTGESAATQA